MLKIADTATINSHFREQFHQLLDQVLDEGTLFRGNSVTTLETEFAKYVNSEDCALVSSGTDALHCAALVADLEPGEEVLCTNFSFLATGTMFASVGAVVKFVDIDPDDWCISIPDLQSKITDKTKVIIWTDFAGQSPNIDAILKIKSEHPDILLVQDAAHATGGEYKGQKLGQHADIVCHSFGHMKNLGAFGNGGAVTASKYYCDRIREVRNHGRPLDDPRGHSFTQGYNKELATFQAAIILEKLKHLDEFIDKKNTRAEYYDQHLKDLVKVPVRRDYCRHAWYMYNIQTERRDELQKFLKSHDIDAKINYPYLLSEEGPCITDANTPNADYVRNTILGIPCGPFITQEQQNYIVSKIKEFFHDK